MIRYGKHGAIPSNKQCAIKYVKNGTVRRCGKNGAIRYGTVRLVRCDTARQVQSDTHGKYGASWHDAEWLVR